MASTSLILSFGFFASSLFAQMPPPRPPAPGESQPLLALQEYLQLTQEQLKRIHQNLEQHRRLQVEKLHAVQMAERALEESRLDPAATDKQLRDLNQRLADAHFQQLSQTHALLKTNLALLTPEQAGRFRAALPVFKALERSSRPPRPEGPPLRLRDSTPHKAPPPEPSGSPLSPRGNESEIRN